MKLRSVLQLKRILPTSIPPSAAWILVWGPAWMYFWSTRLFSAGWFGNELGETITHQLHVLPVFRACHILAQQVFEPADPQQPCVSAVLSSKSSDVFLLKYPLQRVLSSGQLEGVVDAIWRHDPDLERGYLLLSESVGRGRLWRWEVGGGPIAIGKTLHLDDAGCRSAKCVAALDFLSSSAAVTTKNIKRLPRMGSGALAIDFYQHGNPSDVTHMAGALTVAESGEGRIVRLEENGARTPLLMHVPCPASCQSSSSSAGDGSQKDDPACPIPHLQQMAFTARGDLLVAVNYKYLNDDDRNFQCDAAVEGEDTTPLDRVVGMAAILRLEHAVHIPALASLPESRLAHEWTAVHHNHSVSILYTSPELVQLGGMTMASAKTLCASAILRHQDDGTQRVVLLEFPIGMEDMDDEDDDDDLDEKLLLKTKNGDDKAKLKTEPTVVVDLSAYTQRAGAVAVSAGGTFFIATEQSVLIATRRDGVVGRLNLGEDETPTAVVVGGDGYLYITSANKLFRIRTKEKPVQVPTNLVARAPSSLLKT